MEKDLLINEANRCLNCKKPLCKIHCPISTDIPKIIELYKENKLDEAGKLLFENNPLSLVCSIVCPHENQCMGNCIRGIKGEPINFPEIEKEISGRYLENLTFEIPEKKSHRVAIIGSGPAGITIAFILAQRGYSVTIFEKHEKLGGVLQYGIPEFRLPRTILSLIEKKLLTLGVKIKYNSLIGPVTTIDDLFRDGYESIFIGTGVWNPKPLNIKGETLGHVHYAINYLKSPNSFSLGNNVIVIGAGNVAMDAARVAKRSGSNVTIVYRRGFEHMPATQKEIEEAKEDGVNFILYNSPLEILENGMKFIKTEAYLNENGEKSLREIPGSENIISCDSIIIAVSQSPKNNIVSKTTDIEINRWGLIVTDEVGHTTKKGVFAGGDVVTGAKTVVEAVNKAKKVAESIIEFCEEV
ncbi:MAG: NAD(P)-dependent oxidoreductase [Cetobacterium sp.]|uniref:NAD(P)-dependent oxidoreductase n=1 Tax=Cetobacterium sp. TaxID=2071632 RepID=UPI003F2D6E19